jgi:hypothetical protein
MPPDQLDIPSEYLQYASRFYVGANTFHESYFVSELKHDRLGHQHRAWGDFFARFARYATFWAHYDNNVYREVHRWSELYKDTYNLYHFTRSIFSPAHRSIEFWANHILGGSLDPLAGDGVTRPSALPIVTENEAIRAPIAQVWRDSNWQAKKEVWARFGAAMGDSAVMVVDDPLKQKVQFKVVDPRTLRDAVPDNFGNVVRYIIEEQRPDPESRTVTGFPVYAVYTEACERIGESIRYATFRNGLPYDWRAYEEGDPNAGTLVEWTEDYGFVPLVVVPHKDIGLQWGESELQPTLSKLHEVDDLASKLNDWIRVTVDCPWLFTGVVPPGTSVSLACPAVNELMVGNDEERPKGRERIPVLYSNDKDTKAHPLIAPLNVAAVSAHIAAILAAIEAEHPELVADDVGPQSSGEARKVAREKVEAVVVQRRSGYDDAMVRANQMAISIGAIKGYPGFEGFTSESYARGEIDHSIGSRPVFSVDTGAKIAESLARAQVVKTLTDAGVSKESAMRQAGWSEEEIAAEVKAKELEESKLYDMIKQRQIAAMSDVTLEGGTHGVAQHVKVKY